MKLIFDNCDYMVFEILFSYKNKYAYNKLELQIYNKHMCTETILIGEKALKCKSDVQKFNKNNLDDANDYFEIITEYARPFDIH